MLYARRLLLAELRHRVCGAAFSGRLMPTKAEPPKNRHVTPYVLCMSRLRSFSATSPSPQSLRLSTPQLMDGGGRMGPPLHSVARSRGSISLSDAGNPLAANRLFDVCGVGHYFAADPRRSHPFARGGEGRCRLWWWPVPCHIMFAHCQMSSTLVGT